MAHSKFCQQDDDLHGRMLCLLHHVRLHLVVPVHTLCACLRPETDQARAANLLHATLLWPCIFDDCDKRYAPIPPLRPFLGHPNPHDGNPDPANLGKHDERIARHSSPSLRNRSHGLCSHFAFCSQFLRSEHHVQAALSNAGFNNPNLCNLVNIHAMEIANSATILCT